MTTALATVTEFTFLTNARTWVNEMIGAIDGPSQARNHAINSQSASFVRNYVLQSTQRVWDVLIQINNDGDDARAERSLTNLLQHRLWSGALDRLVNWAREFRAFQSPDYTPVDRAEWKKFRVSDVASERMCLPV